MADAGGTEGAKGKSALGRVLRWLRRGFLLLLGLVLLYGLVSEVGTRITVNPGTDPLEGEIEVFMISDGLHVDVVVPARNAIQDWIQWLPRDSGLLPYGKLAFGWGERNFYTKVPTWDDLTVPIACKAVFWPSETAVHVSSWPVIPEHEERVHLLRLSAEGYNQLVAYLKESFVVDAEGRPLLLDHPGYHAVRPDSFTRRDRFFQGKGHYSLAKTCNTWANDALKVMGKSAALWTPFVRGVRFHLPKNDGMAR